MFQDLGENSIGFKQNALLQHVDSQYFTYIDDDDAAADICVY